jgi:hypothetical protein
MTVVPHMRSFTNDGSALKRLSNKTWEMDGQWLNQLDEQDWKNAIIQFQNKLTDSVIETAVRKIPPEIYAISGKKLQEKLKGRRNGLLEHAMEYYRFLATNAYVVGSEEQEFFAVTKEGDDITITASRNGSKDKKDIIYKRTFTQKDTKKIYILGLDGNDHFDIDENVTSSIKLQLEGGNGDDVYNVRGKIKTTIEDDNSKNKTGLVASSRKKP